MIGATLVSSSESTWAFFAAARLSGASPSPAHVLSRSIGLHGIVLLIEGILGSAVGTTASIENIGLFGLTRIGSRRVVQISTTFMICFSIFGKFGAFFASIPLPLFASIYCVLLGIVVAVGISFTQFVNTNSMRNQYVLGLSLSLGISVVEDFVLNTTSYGHGPVKTNAGWVILTLCLVVTGVQFNDILVAGVPWWKLFQDKKGDVRNEEFYSVPIRFSEYIPSRVLWLKNLSESTHFPLLLLYSLEWIVVL